MARKSDKQLAAAAASGKGNVKVEHDPELAQMQKTLAREFATGLHQRLPKLFDLIDRLMEPEEPLSTANLDPEVVQRLVEVERLRGSRIRYEVQLVLGLLGKIAADKKEYQNQQPVQQAPQFNFLIEDGGRINRGTRDAVDRAISVSTQRRTNHARAAAAKSVQTAG